MLGVLSRPELRIWLAIVGAATLILGTAYAMVQQSTRLSANDLPQLTAQTIKKQLEQGAKATDVVPGSKVDLSSDLAIFITVTDDSRHVLASSAELDGKTPLPPVGTFDYTKQHSDDTFTWQPAEKARQATYMTTYQSGDDTGVLIVGQSLKPFEDRVSTYALLMFAGWLAVLAWTSLLLLLPVQKLVVRRKA